MRARLDPFLLLIVFSWSTVISIGSGEKSVPNKSCDSGTNFVKAASGAGYVACTHSKAFWSSGQTHVERHATFRLRQHLGASSLTCPLNSSTDFCRGEYTREGVTLRAR
jgi:hypothetical protein